MADDLARVVLTREQQPAPLSAFVIGTRALPRLLCFTTLTGLYTGLCARGTGSLEDLKLWTLQFSFLFKFMYLHHDKFPYTCALHRPADVNRCLHKTISD